MQDRKVPAIKNIITILTLFCLQCVM